MKTPVSFGKYTCRKQVHKSILNDSYIPWCIKMQRCGNTCNLCDKHHRITACEHNIIIKTFWQIASVFPLDKFVLLQLLYY